MTSAVVIQLPQPDALLLLAVLVGLLDTDALDVGGCAAVLATACQIDYQIARP